MFGCKDSAAGSQDEQGIVLGCSVITSDLQGHWSVVGCKDGAAGSQDEQGVVLGCSVIISSLQGH